MRFLFLFSTSTLTGQAAQSFNILRSLVKTGHKVFAVADQNRTGDLNSLIEKSGAVLIRDVSVSNKNKLFGKSREINLLRSVILDMRPDFVVSSFSNDHFSAGIALKNLEKKPKIIRFFHSPGIRGDFLHKSLYQKTDVFIFYDYDIYAGFKSRYNSLRERLFLFPSCIDTEIFVPKDGAEFRKRFGLEGASFVIGYVGMFQKGRMHRELIDAFIRVKKGSENSRLLMVGSGETLEDIKRYARRKADTGDIVFTGFVGENELVDSYNAMDVFVLLRGGHDSSLRMLYEAQSCGTYILTYKNFPASRLIETTGYGSFFSDVSNTQSIAKTIESVRDFADNSLRKDIHNRVAQEFGLKKSADLFLRICENLLKK